MRVLHVLQSSLPAPSGYAIRTSYILRFQRALGLEPYGVTSARHPDPGVEVEEVEGVPFRRTPELRDAPPSPLREWMLMQAMGHSIRRAMREWNPDLVHAHSPVLVGWPALRAAREGGKPFVYEVRDLWENASVVHGKFGAGSPAYRAARAAETRVLRGADAVVTICEPMRDHLAGRVRAGRLPHVVGNGVAVDRFDPAVSTDELRSRLGLGGKRIFGFLGSLEPWEGLPDLIRCVPRVLAAIPDAHLLITGGGHLEGRLREMVADAGLSASVTLTGRVPHAEVDRYLALCDVLVYPRSRSPVTELTTPLKPLEAMAMARPVVVSDVAALLTLVSPGETGMVFRAGDPYDLAEQVVRLLADPDLRSRLGGNARYYVTTQRDWSMLVSGYRDVYRDAQSRHVARRA